MAWLPVRKQPLLITYVYTLFPLLGLLVDLRGGSVLGLKALERGTGYCIRLADILGIWKPRRRTQGMCWGMSL